MKLEISVVIIRGLRMAPTQCVRMYPINMHTLSPLSQQQSSLSIDIFLTLPDARLTIFAVALTANRNEICPDTSSKCSVWSLSNIAALV